MKKLCIIYGSSAGGQKVAETLRSFDIEFDCFIDSNSEMWGTTVMGKVVYSPDYILDKECSIIIASDAGYSAIKDKLRKMGKSDTCILKEELILPKVQAMNKEIKNEVFINLNDNVETNNLRSNVFLELMEGYQLGGIENWSYNVSKGLKKKGIYTKILCQRKKDMPDEWKDITCDEFEGDYSNYKKGILEVYEYLVKNLPCTLLLNKHQQVMYAGYLLKQRYPELVKLYSIVHNDLEALYDRHTYMDTVLEGYLCVSKKIKNELKTKYHVTEDRLFNKESPVVFDESNSIIHLDRTYTLSRKQPIRIAYGARLEKEQKRADLIIPFIEELEKRGCNYCFDIAGDGTYLPILIKYVEEHLLSYKIRIHGKIEHDAMQQFWSNADAFISLSEMEGLSISMIEAMMCGAVPIMFDVAGCDEFINNGENGFVLSYEDYKGLVDKIENLESNRQLLSQMGQYCKDLVAEKCDLEDYINYIINMISGTV
ncbi:glycosyltransferase [Anaerocolumna sp. AGMB13025]|uniref:glycosyltransferase n=1 Tax=Anaerocolumna sp. AGMB13025 TaxID=3039116 RepID=UPI00241CACB0|nr:glycosyltransferase [Anaerocolumna sp. AGMB13025]WFR56793.1 glycosyltransferase [Anaerocolumna sp. AGMB13025]